MDFESKNLTISRGKILFAEFLPGTKIHGAYREMGNCPEFALTREDQTYDHYSSQVRGFRTRDLSLVISSELNGSVTTDDCSVENLRLWFMSKVNVITSTSLSSQTQVFEEVKVGDIYQIGETNLNPTGLRNLTGVTVTNGVTPTPTTYDLGTDYDLDATLGIITVLPTGNIPTGGDITVNYSTAASTRTQIEAGSTAVEGALKFVSFNPLGADADIFIPYAQISPNGDLSMLSDPESPDVLSIPLTIKALKKGNMALAYRDDRPAI